MRQFIDEEAEAAHEAECDAARLAQTSRFAVAPGFSVPGATRAFGPGETLEPSDLSQDQNYPAWQRMRDLVEHGHVIELSQDELAARKTPSTARFVTLKGVGTSRGILGAGHEITAADFPAGQRRIDQLVLAGYVADRRAPPPYPDNHLDDGPDAA